MGIESFINLYGKTKDLVSATPEKLRKLGDKYQDFQQWQEDMGYYDSAAEQHSPTWDLLDKLGIVGSSGDAWDPETRGTGEKEGWLTQKLPAYLGKTGEEHGIMSPLIVNKDVRALGLNLAKGVWDYVAKPVPQMTAEGYKYLYNKGLDVDRAIAEKVPFWPAADREKYKMSGWGAAGTWAQDTLAGVADFFGIKSMPQTKLYEEGVNTVASNLFNVEGVYTAPKMIFKNDNGNVTFKNQVSKSDYENAPGQETWAYNPDLSQWSTYQYWKGGNWDNADDRRIQKRVNSRMEKLDFGPDDMYPLFLAEAQMPGREHYLDDKMYYYKEFVKRSKNDIRNMMSDRFEFEETGKDYGKWASDQYQGNMIKKYGKYPLFTEGIALDENETLTQLESLSQDISPFEGLASNFELANKDYMKAIRAGKKPANIGEPTEWDYGMFDTKEGVGLSEPDWMKYSSDEAKEFWKSNQMSAIELGGLLAFRAPFALRGPAQRWLQTTGLGRTLREIAPGLLQHGSQARFGLPTMYEGRVVADLLWNYPVKILNKLRPKGLQAGAVIERSERLGPFDRGSYEYE